MIHLKKSSFSVANVTEESIKHWNNMPSKYISKWSLDMKFTLEKSLASLVIIRIQCNQN